MKQLICVCLSVFYLLSGPTLVFAHQPGEPSFVYVNDVAVVHYPIGYASLPSFKPPQDIVLPIHVVGETLKFHLDLAALPYLPEEVPHLTFTWDLGDGTTHTGTSFEYIYRKPGSKTVTITTRDSLTNDPDQILNTVHVNIVPTADYKLPQPLITVNGNVTGNQYTDSLDLDFSKRITLDASRSTTGSAPITSTTWDLGNEQLSRDAKVSLTYKELYSSVQPILRLTDANGLFVEASVQLNNSTLAGPGSTPTVAAATQEADQLRSTLPFIVGGMVGLAGILLFWHKQVGSKRNYH